MQPDEKKFKTIGCGILFLVTAGGLLFFALRPFSGAVPQALDTWPRAWWMVTHFHDDAAFPPKANLCAAPFCRDTHTSRVYVGGNPGHVSESKLRFCASHTPEFPKWKSRFDDLLRFIYWAIAMAISLGIGLAVPGILLGVLMFAERRLEQRAARKVMKVLAVMAALVVTLVMVAWAAAWVMFAWW